ncbi:MAG: hypothetical protein WC728_13720 [Elusimicrobiota bacterium]
MAPAKMDLRQMLSGIQGEALVLRDAFRMRGGKFFARPIGMAAIVIFCAYYYVYTRAGSGLDRVQKMLDAAQATAQYADEYKNLKARLDGLSARLPPETTAAEDWLLGAVRRTLRQEGIVPESTSPPKEATGDTFRFISISVKSKASFLQAASWISRIERGADLLFVQTLRLSKEHKPIGTTTVDVTVTSVARK